MRKTKIIATLGPATDSAETIGKLIEAGVNVFRLNMSHGKHDWVRRVVKDVRAIATEKKLFIGILMDLQGPAIRTGDLPAPIKLKPGQKFIFTVRGEYSDDPFSTTVNYDGFIDDISVGNTVLVDNGVMHMKVLAKRGNKVECEVLTEGTLGNRRHINLPGVKVGLPAFTEKDLADAAVGIEVGVDFLALSFVRDADGLRQLKKAIKPSSYLPQIIAKIEDQQAVKNLEEVVQEADAIMVARGDLGIEVPYDELPLLQRHIVKTCLRVGKPVIVATQMLESMIENPMPTRAEVTDVANAIFEQADAIMLSGETSTGKYPLKCIEVFDRIATRTERSDRANYFEAAQFTSPRQKLAKSAVVMANELQAEAIIVFTLRGNMGRHTAWMRPRSSPIIAVCDKAGIANGLALSWGVRSVITEYDHARPEQTIESSLKLLQERGLIHAGKTVVVISSITSGNQIVDAIQMRIV